MILQKRWFGPEDMIGVYLPVVHRGHVSLPMTEILVSTHVIVPARVN